MELLQRQAATSASSSLEGPMSGAKEPETSTRTADETIAQAATILGEAAEVVGPYDGAFDLSGCDNLAGTVLAVIRRHPMRESRLTETLASRDDGYLAQPSGALEGYSPISKERAALLSGDISWIEAYVGKLTERLRT